MRFRSWRIEGFGAFRGWQPHDLCDGVNLLYGPNEAGKSTLLAYLRFMLFGFRGGTAKESRYPPCAGLPHGGRLWLTPHDDEDFGELAIERFAPSHGAPQRIRLLDPSGEEIDPSRLSRVLGGADRKLYANVFAFSLSELQSLESLSATGVQDHIFSAGITGAGRSARDALKRIDREAIELYPTRTKGRIRELAVELASMDAKLGELRARAGEYPRLAEEEARLARQLDTMRSEVAALRAVESHTTRLIATWRDVWSPLEELREALAKLEPIDDVPDAARSRLARCVDDERRAREAVDRIARARDDLAREREALEPERATLALRERVDALEAERALHEARLREKPVGERNVAQSESRLRDALDLLGPEWTPERLRTFDASMPRCEEAAALGDALLDATRVLIELESRRERLDLELLRIERRRDAAIAERDAQQCANPDELRRRRETLARIRSIGHERDALDDRANAIAELHRLQASTSRGWGLASAASLFAAIVVALGLAHEGGRVEIEWQRHALGAAAAGALATIASAIGFARRRRTRRSRLEAIDADAKRVSAALGERVSELEALTASLGLAANVAEPEVLAAERELERDWQRRRLWERLDENTRRIDREWCERRDDLEVHAQQVESADAKRRAIEEDWLAWQRSTGVANQIAPASVRLFFQSVHRAREILDSCEAEARRVREITNTIDSWEREATALLGSCEVGPVTTLRSPDTPPLLEAFGRLRDRCREAEQRSLRCLDIDKQIAKLDRELESAEPSLAKADRALKELLRAGSARDPDELVRKLDRHDRRRELLGEIESRTRELDRRIGRGDDAEALLSELASGRVGDWESERDRARRDASDAEEQRDEVLRRDQDLRNALAELEVTDRIGALELKRSELEVELAYAVSRWRRLRTARVLIERTLAGYEEERQPTVLCEASHYFARVTSGRYEGIVQSAKLGGFSVLTRDGQRRQPSELSRGTAEQLYVCVRLGLIAEFARRARRLPVVMDDVLVNFDDERARAMAEVVADFSRRTGVQVLVFTCSSRTRELFEASVSGLVALDLGAETREDA